MTKDQKKKGIASLKITFYKPSFKHVIAGIIFTATLMILGSLMFFSKNWTIITSEVSKRDVVRFLVDQRKKECENALGPSGYQFFNTFILEDEGNRIWIDCIKK